VINPFFTVYPPVFSNGFAVSTGPVDSGFDPSDFSRGPPDSWAVPTGTFFAFLEVSSTPSFAGNVVGNLAGSLDTGMIVESLELLDKAERVIDVSMKIMAAPVVILAIAVAGPREPNMVWLDPPNPAPIDAPFPCCRRTITIRAIATVRWTVIIIAVSIL
jgi:hypothetical protein